MSRSKYKLHDKVMITSNVLYPNEAWLMGIITGIHSIDDDFMYDIHYGITDIPDLKNVREENLKFYE